MRRKLDCIDSVTNEEAAKEFVERLATLRLVDWLSVAASVTQTAGTRTEANAALERVVVEYGLALDAWTIGDDIETAFHCSVGTTGIAPSPRVALSLSIARDAASKAARALFVRPLLTTADFESLYRPFATLAPAHLDTRRTPAPRPSLTLVARRSPGSRRGTA